MISSSITRSLGAGSGIDTVALIDSLAEATRAPLQAAIDRRTTLNSSRISTIASVSSSIDSFASSLQALIDGGSLRKSATVSDPTVLSANVIVGSRPSASSNQLSVDSVASGQTLISGYLASATEAVGKGDFTISSASGNVTVQIDDSNNSLSGLAAAINAAVPQLSASVVSDADGARLVVRGAMGAANAFAFNTNATDGLERFAFGTGVTSTMSQAQSASDAVVRLDGVPMRRTTNTIRDIVDGVEINLLQAKPGTTVTVALSNPTANLRSSINDFVSAFNQVKQQLDTALSATDGPLRGNEAMIGLRRSLAKLPTAQLVTSGNGPSMLAEVGVKTNRDGTLSVDAARLTSILASDPDGVEALFNPAQYSSSPDVVIKSVPGRVRAGTYSLTNLVAPNGATPATGLIDGRAATSIGRNLVAPAGSAALGLIVAVNADVAAATITIEPGLGGVLDGIRDALRSNSGPLSTTSEKLAKEKAAISSDQQRLDTRLQRYRDLLTKNYADMDSRVASFRATQSYLTQQISIWNNSNR